MPLPTCECVAGLPTQQQLANIYCALYTLAQDGGGVTFPITPAQGGTGLTSYAVGDLIYANGAASLARLADVATGNALISGGVGVAPSWGKIGLTTHVSGILSAANGGTGVNNGNATLTITNSDGITLNGPGSGNSVLGIFADITLNASGPATLDITSAGAPTSGGGTPSPGDYYGNQNFMLGGPSIWITVSVGGNNYRVAGYQV